MNRTKSRLLVVDDVEAVRNLITTFLTELGFPAIDHAVDGLDALQQFHRGHYDLVITDWNMPRATGIELLRAIRTAPEHGETPVLVLSGHVTTARVVEAIEAGANGFVAKPWLFPALSDKVLRLVSGLAPVTDFFPSVLPMAAHA